MTNSLTEHDILLVEDDSDDVEIFQEALQEIGVDYSLRNAYDGTILFELLNERVPDVLFLDHHMPCKNGIECLKEIRKDKSYDNMPVIMYSYQILPFAIHGAYNSDANLYMVKTSTFNDLVEKMRLIFQRPWKNYLSKPRIEQFVL